MFFKTRTSAPSSASIRPAKGAGPKPSNSIILVPGSNIFFLLYKLDYLSLITTSDTNLQSCDHNKGKTITKTVESLSSTEKLRNNCDNGWCKIKHR